MPRPQPATSHAATKNNYVRLCAILGATFLLSLVSGKFYNAWRDKQVVYRSEDGAAPPALNGPAQVEAQGRRLLASYRAHNFDFLPFFSEVGLQGLRLPDQASAESEGSRAANTSGWVFPHTLSAFHNVAFYTENYAFSHVKRLRDGTMTSNPSGYYLVVMKNGDINRIPVSQVRLLPMQGRNMYVFPGVEGYSDSLSHAPNYTPVTAKAW